MYFLFFTGIEKIFFSLENKSLLMQVFTYRGVLRACILRKYRFINKTLKFKATFHPDAMTIDITWRCQQYFKLYKAMQ